MMNHTPGPWHCENGRGIKTADGEHVSGLGLCTLLGGQPEDREEAEANTRLMAAAPELLAALEDMVKSFGYTDWSSVHDAARCEHAREVLAKVKGNKP